jgi:hypothetical protein
MSRSRLEHSGNQDATYNNITRRYHSVKIALGNSLNNSGKSGICQ